VVYLSKSCISSSFLSRISKIKIRNVQLKAVTNIAVFIKFLVVLLQAGELIN